MTDDREKEIVYLHDVEKKTFKEIARDFLITPARVGQLYKKAKCRKKTYPLGELEISISAANALLRAGVSTLEDFKNIRDFKSIRGIGKYYAERLEQIQKKLLEVTE